DNEPCRHVRRFLLRPMADARQDMEAAYVRAIFPQSRFGLRRVPAEHLEHEIAVAAHEKSWLMHFAILHALHHGPIVFGVAIAIERTAKTRVLELSDIIVDIGGAQP